MPQRRDPDLRGFAAFAAQVEQQELPDIVTPRFRQLDSGLFVPSSVVDRIAGTPPEIWLPPELRQPAQPIAIVDELPMSADQFAGAMNEEELGLPLSTLDSLLGLVELLPFERCILLAARLQAKLYDIREDADAQVGIVRYWGMPELADAIDAVLQRHRNENRRLVVFAEQYLTVLQRLLVERAAALAMDYEPTDLDLKRMIRAIFAAATVTSSADADLQDIAVDADPERWLIYTLKNGLYNARPNLVNEVTRARELFAILAPDLQHDQFIPIDDWFRDDYGLSTNEQLVAAFAAGALVQAFNDEIDVGERSLTAPPLWRGELEDRSPEIEALLSATRNDYVAAFNELPGGLEAIAWERRPFLRRPFLRFENGQWMLIAPRMIASWMGEGVLHRVLEAAGCRNQSLRASRFVGALFERYCLDLTKSVYTGERPIGAGRVFGEQPYGTRQRPGMTSDVAVDLGTDLVLFEVVSARLTAEMQVFGNPEILERNLERMLFKKIRQIGDVVTDILDGTATIPDVDPAQVERIWPVIVTAGELMQTELLWDQIDARITDPLRQARVEPLNVFDIGDFELLLALVADGQSLTDILRRKSQGRYRRLEISRFAFDELRIDPLLRLPIIEERWNVLWNEARATLDLHEDDGPQD